MGMAFTRAFLRLRIECSRFCLPYANLPFLLKFRSGACRNKGNPRLPSLAPRVKAHTSLAFELEQNNAADHEQQTQVFRKVKAHLFRAEPAEGVDERCHQQLGDEDDGNGDGGA